MKQCLSVIFALSISCTTFSDLEREHPFERPCAEGLERNDAGECVTIVEPVNNVSNEPNNLSNEPNNVSNEPNNCNPAPGDCCQTPEGEYCCTSDGCCSLDLAECEPDPPNNPDPVPWSDYMLVIRDAAPDNCVDSGADGPDIYGLQLALPSGANARPYLATFEQGENANADADTALAVIERDFLEPTDCPATEFFSLGCGGLVGIGFEVDDAGADAWGQLVVLESGPTCDNQDDTYSMQVCPMGSVDGADCVPFVDAHQGYFEQEVQLSF